MIKLNNISHKYDDTWILHNTSYTFKQEKYVLMGQSGIGKTTLLNIASKFLKPTSGFVETDSEISYIFQTLNLLEDFTIRENITLAMQIKKKNNDYEKFAKIMQIEETLDKFPSEISQGQKQRAAIARALAIGANFILADEPTGNLDQQNAKIVQNLFSQIHDQFKIGFLISTHDQSWLEHANIELHIENCKISEAK